MKISPLIFLLVAVVVLSASLTMLFYSFYVVKEIRKIPINLTVSDHIGFDLSKEYLGFGMIQRGGSSSRAIFLENKYKESLVVQLKVNGNLANWIEFSENDFVLKENESKKIDVNMRVPTDAEYKNYDSKLRIVFKKQFF